MGCDRSIAARVAAHTRWSHVLDRAEATQKAREAALSRFERQARELHPHATDEQIRAVAESLKNAFYASMALASAKARRAKSTKDRRS
jgi:hypothetical protein